MIKKEPEKGMEIKRISGYAPQTVQLGQDIARLHGQCVGCTECKGLCRELIELLTVPGAVLSPEDRD